MMNARFTDTDPEAERVFVETLRRAPVWKRVAQVLELNRMCRMLVMTDLRRRYPHAPKAELHRRLAARLLEREDVIRAYGWDPEREGY
jgi:hypothetical protein